jgi:hypothetical protein
VSASETVKEDKKAKKCMVSIGWCNGQAKHDFSWEMVPGCLILQLIGIP